MPCRAVPCRAVLCRAVLCCAVLQPTTLSLLSWLAQEVAGQVRKHQDVHKGVSRRESFKLSHVIQDRLAKGGSSQGFGPHASQANSQANSLEALPEEPIISQVCDILTLAGQSQLKAQT